MSSSTDSISNLAKLLPTGTFLVFQSIASVSTNNGNCGHVEKIMTGILILIFSVIAFILTFTDSITTTSGNHYYGLVTFWGLYNPRFKGSTIATVNGSIYTGDSDEFKANIFDIINGILTVVVFAVLALLTPPVSTCYYSHMPPTIIKSVPILVGIVASLYFSFAPAARRAVGYSVAGLVTESAEDQEPTVFDGTITKEAAGSATVSLLTPEEKKADSAAPSPARSPIRV